MGHPPRHDPDDSFATFIHGNILAPFAFDSPPHLCYDCGGVQRVTVQMVKQEPGSGQCGLCTVAMLTDRTREDMLAVFPDYKGKADFEWLNYMRHDLGLILEDPRDDRDFDRTLTCEGKVLNGHFKLPLGFRYYCTVVVKRQNAEIPHAIAIDENGMVFDPGNNAPMTGTCTLEQYVRHNHKIFGEARIGCCYRVIAKQEKHATNRDCHAHRRRTT